MAELEKATSEKSSEDVFSECMRILADTDDDDRKRIIKALAVFFEVSH